MSGRGLTWYKRDPIRFLDGVQGMGPDVIGAYAVLLDLIYARDGEIIRDDRHLSGILGCSIRKARALTDALIDAGKITVRGEKLTQKVAETNAKRTRNEREARANAQRKRRENESAANENNTLGDKPEGTKPPRIDKIRVEDTNVSSSRKTRLRDDAEISEAMRRAAEKRGHSQAEAEAQFARFKNDALAKGKTFLDWDRAFVTWLDSPYFRPITRQEASNAAADAERIAELYRARVAGREGQGSVVPLLPAGSPAGGRDDGAG